MTQSLLGKLFGDNATEVRQRTLLLDAIGQLQHAVLAEQVPAPLDLSGMDSPLREVGHAINEVVTLLSDKLEQSRNDIKKNQVLLHENQLVRKALDCASTNVMIADTNLDIIYMNEAVTGMLNQAETDIKKELYSFNANQLMGANIDSFHKNPGHQRAMLAKLNSTYRTQIQLGGRTFSLIANPVFNDTGERLGSVVEWADRTKEVMIEKEMSDIVQ
ncbi:MAG: methyl-accepting chemotaxis protein, partial [Aeromonas veronii]